MKPPCRGCKHEKKSKLNPFIWLKPPPRGTTNRTARYIPGYNKPNPCPPCEKRQQYADWIAGLFIQSPTTGAEQEHMGIR